MRNFMAVAPRTAAPHAHWGPAPLTAVRIAVLAAVLSVLVSAGARFALAGAPPPLVWFAHSDVAAMVLTQPTLERHWPYFTYPFFYQPLLGWLTAALSYVAPSPLLLVLLIDAVVAAGAGITAALLCGMAGPRRTLAFWSLSPQLLLFGGANVDALAVLLLVLATRSAHGRGYLSAVWLALGTAMKAFPLVALPPLILTRLRARPRRALGVGLVALGVLAIVDGPAVLAPHSLLTYGVAAYADRPWNIDSIWLPVALVLRGVASDVTVDRAISAISLGGVAVSYVLLVLRPSLRGADAMRLGWLGVCVLLLWTRLHSVQYAIWLLPVFALYVPRYRLFALMILGDVLVYLAVTPFNGLAMAASSAEAAPFVAAIAAGVIVRHAAVIRLTFLLARGDRR